MHYSLITALRQRSKRHAHVAQTNLTSVVARRKNVGHCRVVLDASELGVVLEDALGPSVTRVGTHVVQDDAAIFSRRRCLSCAIAEAAGSGNVRGAEQKMVLFGMTGDCTDAVLEVSLRTR